MKQIQSFLPLLLLAGLFFLIWHYQKNPAKIGKIIVFAIIGGLLGIPLSYFFQSNSRSIASYLNHFNNGLTEDFVGNVGVGIVIFAIVGAIVGYIISEKQKID